MSIHDYSVYSLDFAYSVRYPYYIDGIRFDSAAQYVEYLGQLKAKQTPVQPVEPPEATEAAVVDLDPDAIEKADLRAKLKKAQIPFGFNTGLDKLRKLAEGIV